MSNKSQLQTQETKNKISEAKTKFNYKALEVSWQTYQGDLEANPELMPSLAGLAKRFSMSKQTILNNSHIPQVQSIIDDIQTLQEEYLLTNGITGKASPSFAQFLLKAKHSYTDDKPSLTQNNFMNISPDVLADALKLMNENPPTNK